MTTATGAGPLFGLVLMLSLPFYALGVTGAALPFATALPLSAMMAVVPTVAALVLISRSGGRVGVKTFLTNVFSVSRGTPAGWIFAAGFMVFAAILSDPGMHGGNDKAKGA